MNAVTKWLGWLVVILALHLTEQMLTGLDELSTLRGVLSPYFGWFAQPDYGVVLLVLIIATLVNSLVYLIARGGQGRRVALGVFGIIGVGELHHLGEALVTMRYNPGMITAIPYVFIGILLLRALWQESRAGRAARDAGTAAQHYLNDTISPQIES
jgi:hypothetical protein